MPEVEEGTSLFAVLERLKKQFADVEVSMKSATSTANETASAIKAATEAARENASVSGGGRTGGVEMAGDGNEEDYDALRRSLYATIGR